MQVGIEFVSLGRRDLLQEIALEGGRQLPEGDFHAFAQGFDGLVGLGQGGLQAVLDRHEALGKGFDPEFARLGNVFLGTAANILGFGHGAQRLLLLGLDLGLGGGQFGAHGGQFGLQVIGGQIGAGVLVDRLFGVPS